MFSTVNVQASEECIQRSEECIQQRIDQLSILQKCDRRYEG